MPTVAELQRLEALVGRLTPLAKVQRGELIRAEVWNVVVGALIEVARAVLAEDRESIVPPHEHPDQVSAGWLDPRLRSLVERGPLADPAAAATVSNLERQLARLGDRIDEVNNGVQEVRDRVSEVSTRDLTREAEVTSVRRTIEGMSDSRDDVLALRQTLGSIQQDLSVAVEASELLVVDGEPVDMTGVVERIRNVEVLRERLITPSGELLDAGALEERLTELTNTLVTEEELDAALESRPAQVSPEQIEELEGELRSDLNQGLETSMGRLAEKIRAEMSERLADVDALVARAVADALPGLQESVLGQVRPEITSAVQEGMEETQAIFERRLGETEAALREDFGNRIEDIQRNIAVAVRTEFARQLPSHLDPIRADMEALSERVERLEGIR